MEHSPSCVWFSAKGCCLCSWPPPPHVMPMTLCLHLSVNFLNSRKHRLTTTSTPPSYPPSHELLIFLVPESPTQASAFTCYHPWASGSFSFCRHKHHHKKGANLFLLSFTCFNPTSNMGFVSIFQQQIHNPGCKSQPTSCPLPTASLLCAEPQPSLRPATIKKNVLSCNPHHLTWCKTSNPVQHLLQNITYKANLDPM